MNKRVVSYDSKNGCCIKGRKDLEESLKRKISIVHFSVKNTENNADTWGFIQQFFQHSYNTANSNGHLVVKVETAQILWYKQQHISPGRIQHHRAVLERLVVKVKTAQIHIYR